MTWQAALLAGLATVLAALIAGLVSRYMIRQARQANTDDRDAVWNAAYRNAVEPHLFWDVARVNDLERAQAAINRLEDAAVIPRTEFPAIPPPPPLFPKLEGGKPIVPPSK